MIEEQRFNYLRKQAFYKALSIVKEHNTAEDIVHNSLLKLIKRIDSVECIESWLFTVVKNESIAYIRKKRRLVSIDSGLSGRFILNQKSIKEFEEEKYSYHSSGSSLRYISNREKDIELHKKAVSMLKKNEKKLFRTWQKSPNSIKSIASKMNINYHTVDKKINIMKRNLKANIKRLRHQNVGKSILQYRQYINITNMMKTFCKNLQAGDFSIMKHYGADVDLRIIEELKIDRILDWAIVLKPGKKYQLYVFVKTLEYLKVIFIQFRIDKKNFIKIQSYGINNVKKLNEKAKKKVRSAACINGRLQVSCNEF